MQTSSASMPAPTGESSVLRLLEPPARLQVPIPSCNAEAHPAVAAGTVVVKGEALLSSLPDGGAAAIAPTSGRVVRTSRVSLTSGRVVDAIELEPDFEDRSPPEAHYALAHAGLNPSEALEKAAPEDLGRWIDRLRHAGIWADRHCCPDLLGQLHAMLKRPVDTIICNCVDHDPVLRLQATVAGRFAPVLGIGMSLLSRLTTARRAIIAVDAGATPRWWVPLRRELRRAGVEVDAVSSDYPQADPTLLLHALLRRRLRPGRSPVEQGVLLLDGVAAAAIGRAAARGQSMLRVPVAIRDHLRGRSSFLAVHVGTPVRHVLDYLQLPHENVAILVGDVLRDQPIGPEAIVAGSELSLHVMRAKTPAIPNPCIRCGWCTQVCPTRVMPAGVLEAVQERDADLADRYGIDACIECGICSWVCPAHLPLLKGIREMKRIRHEGAL